MAFKKGVSGNPKGRAKGCKTKKTLITEALDAIGKERSIDARKALIESVYDASLDGDTGAAALLLNRLEPAYKSVQQPVELPDSTPSNLYEKGRFVLQLVEAGGLSPDVAREIISSILKLIKVQESDESLKRLDELEAAAGKSL